MITNFQEILKISILSNTECKCLDEDYTTQKTTTTTTTTITTTTTPCFGACTFEGCGWIGDGYCDDGANNLDCNFDGGDCCGPNVKTNYCTGVYLNMSICTCTDQVYDTYSIV